MELKIVLGKDKLRFQKPLSPYQWNWIRARVQAGGSVWILGQHNEYALLYDCRSLITQYRDNRLALPSNPTYRLDHRACRTIGDLLV